MLFKTRSSSLPLWWVTTLCERRHKWSLGNKISMRNPCLHTFLSIIPFLDWLLLCRPLTNKKHGLDVITSVRPSTVGISTINYHHVLSFSLTMLCWTWYLAWNWCWPDSPHLLTQSDIVSRENQCWGCHLCSFSAAGTKLYAWTTGTWSAYTS